MEVWGEGSTWEELQAAVEACPASVKDPWLGPERSFRVHVESYGRSMPMDEQLDYIRKLEFIPFQVRMPGRRGPGPVEAPRRSLWELRTG